jgi:integrase/recombinase XerC
VLSGGRGGVPGSAGLVLADGVPLLHPEPQLFEAMLEGWRNQMLARNLAAATITARCRQVRAFGEHGNAFPWEWSPAMADEWFADLRSIRGCTRSTVRGYQVALRGFCEFLVDPAYGWVVECEQRFGTHPVQVITELNAAVHVADRPRACTPGSAGRHRSEAGPNKRAFTRQELQALFDYADEQVARKRALGRKGWVSAFRDATIFKVAYAYGLRRAETRMLDVGDFGRNPEAPEFGEYGVVYVRHGKAKKGSPPKRRSVLTAWPWTPEVLAQWLEEVRPLFGIDTNPAAWPSERQDRVGLEVLNHRLAGYRDALGLGPGLDFHSLRRSYVTHLIEDGWDPRFVQEQVGHEHASTTSIYTCVSSDFRTRTLRRALDGMVAQALGGALGGEANDNLNRGQR